MLRVVHDEAIQEAPGERATLDELLRQGAQRMLATAHWLHLRTTNVIESPFATVRLRERVTKGAGSRTKGLLMGYKLLDMAEKSCRRLNGAELLPQVRLGVQFVDGVSQERGGQATRQAQVKTKRPRRRAA